jgi:hypothetical protein
MGLGGLSRPANLAAKLVLLAGAVLATVAFLTYLFSESPSSTGSLVFLFVGIYSAIAIALIAGLDRTIRRAHRS